MALIDKLVAVFPLDADNLPYTNNGQTITAHGGAAYQAASPGPAWVIGASSSALKVSITSLPTPFTIVSQWRSPDSPSNNCIISFAPGDENYWEVMATTSTTVIARARVGGTISDSTITAGGGLGGAWHNVAGVYASATSRRVYLDGAFGAEATTSCAPAGSNNYFGVGAIRRDGDFISDSAPGDFFKWAAVFDEALTLAELDEYFANPSAMLGGGSGSAVPLSVLRPAQGIFLAHSHGR